MDDDIIRMAQEAQQERFSLDGRSVPSTALSGYWFSMEVADLARFAALVAAAERERIKAEPAEQKDAARWRFLVDNSFDKENVVQFHVWEHSWEPHSQTGEPTEWKQRVRGPALNRFIDHAIERAHNITDPQVADRLARHGIPMPEGDPK